MTRRRDRVSQWVEKAENDLRNAEHTLELEERCPLDTVCFHAHQCVEKCLKALLLHREAAFPRTHDLVILSNLAAKKAGLALPDGAVQRLNRYSIEARHPGDWPPITRKEAQRAVAFAQDIRARVRALLPDSLGEFSS